MDITTQINNAIVDKTIEVKNMAKKKPYAVMLSSVPRGWGELYTFVDRYDAIEFASRHLNVIIGAFKIEDGSIVEDDDFYEDADRERGEREDYYEKN